MGGRNITPKNRTEPNGRPDQAAASPAPKAEGSNLPICKQPTCPVDAECGACQHTSVPYADQLAAKDAAIAHLFSEAIGESDESILHPIIGMEDPYFYRNKVMSPFVPGRKIHGLRGSGRGPGVQPGTRRGKGRGKDRDAGSDAQQGPNRRSKLDREVLTGMYAAGTHRIIPTDACLIENADAKRVVKAVASLMGRFGIPPYKEDTGAGFMRHVVVRVGHTSGEVLVTLVTNAREFPAAKAFCRELVKRCPFVTTVVQNINMRQTNVVLGQEERTLYGPGFILDTLCGLSFRISSQSFYQVNSVQTEVLYRAAIRLARLSGRETVIDAYCGTGTIGLVAAANGAHRVIGVESVASAVRDARQNARHNGIGNAVFVASDAAELMGALAGRASAPDAAVAKAVACIAGMASDGEDAPCAGGSSGIDPANTVLFMDPPRAGSSDAFLEAAVAFGPARIVYISCNPETQVRDVSYLMRCGYAVDAIQPVDMFPHTDHIECIVSLVLRR